MHDKKKAAASWEQDSATAVHIPSSVSQAKFRAMQEKASWEVDSQTTVRPMHAPIPREAFRDEPSLADQATASPAQSGMRRAHGAEDDSPDVSVEPAETASAILQSMDTARPDQPSAAQRPPLANDDVHDDEPPRSVISDVASPASSVENLARQAAQPRGTRAPARRGKLILTRTLVVAAVAGASYFLGHALVTELSPPTLGQDAILLP